MQISTRFGTFKKGKHVFVSLQLLNLVSDLERMQFFMIQLSEYRIAAASFVLFHRKLFITLEERNIKTIKHRTVKIFTNNDIERIYFGNNHISSQPSNSGFFENQINYLKLIS